MMSIYLTKFESKRYLAEIKTIEKVNEEPGDLELKASTQNQKLEI